MAPGSWLIGDWQAFASGLVKRLNHDVYDPDATETLLKEFPEYLRSLQITHNSAPGNVEIEKIGTQLWNLCNRLKREVQAVGTPSDNTARLLRSSRVFAFLLTYIVHWKGGETEPLQAVHVLRTGLKAGKVCLG